MVGADLCVRPFGGPTRRSAPTRIRQAAPRTAIEKLPRRLKWAGLVAVELAFALCRTVVDEPQS